MRIPQISLTHGQALWVISGGQQPERRLVNETRYLRLLGIPFAEGRQGRGNRIRYTFYDLVELAVALYAMESGRKPREIAKQIVAGREELRPIFGRATLQTPEKALNGDWVKSRRAITPLLEREVCLRLHDRVDDEPGKIGLLSPAEISDLRDFGILTERYPGEKARRLVPLTRLILELAAWLQEVPEFRPGPQ